MMFLTTANCWRLGGCLKCCRQLLVPSSGNQFNPTINPMINTTTSIGKSEDDKLPDGSIGSALISERVLGQFYQHSFASFESMILEEKAEAKKCILIKDKTDKLQFITKGMMERILDSPITIMYKYSLNSHKYCLVKLDDYPQFAQKNVNNFPYQSFPVHSRLYTLLSDSIQLIKDDLTKVEPEVIPDLVRNRKFWSEMIRSPITQDSDSFINTLVNNVLLNELEAKSRFFLINQLEELLCNGPFNQLQLLPFGSSVNGFGWNQSDVDLFLTPQTSTETFCNPYGLKSASSKNMAGDKLDTQRVLNILTGLMKDFIPGVENVVPILMARVPIIKFASVPSGLDGDLTFFLDSRDSGIDIAHVLFEYSRLDVRVVKLMVFTKLWAMQQVITRSAPGVWINSFGLMMLVVHFLQIRSPPLLPPISHLNVIYDPYQTRPTNQTNNLNYDEDTPFIALLTEFLLHLATFDFKNYGCNVMDGLVVTKPTASALHIENPTHRYLNVCKNVQNTELTKLILIANASYGSLCKGNHVSQLLKPFSRKSINVIDFFQDD